VIEPEPAAVLPIAAASEPAKAEPQLGEPKAGAVATSAAAPARRRGPPAAPKAEAVIPLVHAPDDPGPDAVEESEASALPETRGWPKIL
jgi:HemY protein